MGRTKISWATDTWNPLRVRSANKRGWEFGCTKISEACLHCYAGTMNKRLFGGQDYDYLRRPTDFYLDEKVLAQPLHWKKPRTIFVCSMTDLFHENVPSKLIDRVFRIMQSCRQHTFFVLTKRPERARWFLEREVSVPAMTGCSFPEPWGKHIWLGVTAENQERANERIPRLLSVPAAKHFVSVEPMLSGINLDPRWLYPAYEYNAETDRSHKVLPALDWVICGGESGPGARPMHPDWARSLRDQCVQANVPFFLKQMVIDGKMVKMPELDGQTWEQRP